jgi:hypothetical protein
MESVRQLLETLQPMLSQGATVTLDPPSRWSTYKAPKPVAIVNVNSEMDVAIAVSALQALVPIHSDMQT